MRAAIITGASSGLGRAYAQRLDKSGAVDELWLIARREERLIALAETLDASCRILPLDLTDPGSVDTLRALLEDARPQVEYLVCAAGFGKFGRAQDLTRAETDDMISLNCRAAVEVTRISLPWMKKGAHILEVCSCAGFLPLPGMNLYAATKAFLLRYTRALRWELRSKEIHVTAVCPSWIKTEFMAVARDTANPDAVRHTPLAQRPEAVAAWSLTVNRLGGAVATCGPAALALRLGGKLLPSSLAMAAWDRMRRL